MAALGQSPPPPNRTITLVAFSVTAQVLSEITASSGEVSFATHPCWEQQQVKTLLLPHRRTRLGPERRLPIASYDMACHRTPSANPHASRKTRSSKWQLATY